MKANLLTIDGKEKSKIELPKCFSQKIRKDLVAKALETKKIKQPYSPSPVAGNQFSASGKLVHRRHVWKSQYGRGMSRIPRKQLSRKGTQFNWVGATSPNTRGGRRAHPPKIVSMINTRKINKKEMKLALISAISATADSTSLTNKYKRLKNKKIKNLPLIVEKKITDLKTKEFIESLKKILEEDLFELALQKKTIRSGKGKMRGRKYKKNAGLLLVIGGEEKIKIKLIDVVNVKKLGVNDLAKGEPGRLTIYTEGAIKDLGEKFK